MTETSIAINQECAVAAGRGWFRIKCQVGLFRENGIINWSTEINYSHLHVCPSVRMDNDGYVIMVWQSVVLRRLSYANGRVTREQDQPPVSLKWHQSRNFNIGYMYSPSIALSPNNHQTIDSVFLQYFFNHYISSTYMCAF